MKYTVSYEHDITNAPHYFAKVVIDGRTIFRGGENFTQARSRMIETLKSLPEIMGVPIPTPEEIEL